MPLKLQLGLLTLCALFCAYSNAESIHQFELQSLTNQKTVSLNYYSGKLMLISFFEPKCPWCYRQMKTLNVISKECSHQVQPISIGINGNAFALKKELRRAKVAYPSFLANKKLLNKIGKIPATPWMLVADANGEIIGHMRGYIRKEKLKGILGPTCS